MYAFTEFLQKKGCSYKCSLNIVKIIFHFTSDQCFCNGSFFYKDWQGV